MLLIDGTHQDDDLAAAVRHELESSRRRAQVGEGPKRCTQASDFDSQTRTMCFINVFHPEYTRKERVPRHVVRPCFAQGAGEREQHRTPGERNHRRASRTT